MYLLRTCIIFITFFSLVITNLIFNINMRNFYHGKATNIIGHYIPYIGDYLIESDIDKLYDEIGLEGILDNTLFERSLMGYLNLVNSEIVKNKSLITIIDYTRPSSEKRLYVIDLYSRKLLFESLVAHGKNTGDKYAKLFSNEVGSLKSSIGFFVTMDTYTGDNGYSLRLKGLEKDFNDKAEQRYIVMHGADYVSEDYIKENGRIGRSWGCPAVPTDIADSLIDTIKDGSALFIYNDSPYYLDNSRYMNVKTASNILKPKDLLL